MAKRKVAYVRRFVATTLLMTVAAPILFYGAWQSMEGIFTSALKWLSPDDEGRKQYDDFASRFEGGNVILVAWDGSTLDDERLNRLVKALDPEDKDAPLLHQQVFERVFSGRSTFERMTKPPISLSKRLALQRLKGTLIGADGKTTCLIAVLSEEGIRRRKEALEEVIAEAKKNCDLDESQLYLAGPPVDAIAIDKESDRSVDVYSIPSGIICFTLCLICLRSLFLTWAILITGAFGELLMLGSLHFAGVTMDAVLITLPPLVFVLTVSAGIHLVNYYYDELRKGHDDDAPRRAMLNGTAPCSLAAVTTAIGLGSLLVSHIVPVKVFGLFASCGVLVTLVLLFAMLPGVMQKWPASEKRVRRMRARANKRTTSRWNGVASVIVNNPIAFTLAGIALLVAGLIGVTKVQTSVGVRNLFAADSRVMRDYGWFQENVAKLVPLEVVIRFPKEHKTGFLKRIQIVEDIQKEIQTKVGLVGGTMSVATMSPRIPRGRALRDVAARSRLNSRLFVHRQHFIDAHYLYESEKHQDWRISCRVSGVDDGDYERILAELQQIVDPLVAKHATKIDGLNASYTGAMPVVFRAQKTLLSDMFSSMLTAFLLVWLVMLAVLATPKSDRPANFSWFQEFPKLVWLGFLAMLPNIFPIVVIFGWMGWRAIPIDIGSMMTACVALGIAVDDTLHFLSWYRREIHSGVDRPTAIKHCFDHCGTAMVQTTLICGLGLLVFGMSDFVPTGRFAWLMLTLLSSALVADLVFLPAILASPLGKMFGEANTNTDAPPQEIPASTDSTTNETRIAS